MHFRESSAFIQTEGSNEDDNRRVKRKGPNPLINSKSFLRSTTFMVFLNKPSRINIDILLTQERVIVLLQYFSGHCEYEYFESFLRLVYVAHICDTGRPILKLPALKGQAPTFSNTTFRCLAFEISKPLEKIRL